MLYREDDRLGLLILCVFIVGIVVGSAATLLIMEWNDDRRGRIHLGL